jgi:Uma2 family endonuclease
MTGMTPTIAEPVVSTPPPNGAPPRRKLLTAADLAALRTDLPGGTVRYELNDGVLVVMAPPGDFHARYQAKVIIRLDAAESLELGEVRGEVGIVLRRNPDRVVGADAAFILTKSLPAQKTPEGYLETIPELVVEIRSKNDTNAEIIAKADEYFAAGVQVVWIVDPASRTLAAHWPDTSVQVFRGDEPVTCDLLPGFAVPAARFFDGA